MMRWLLLVLLTAAASAQVINCGSGFNSGSGACGFNQFGGSGGNNFYSTNYAGGGSAVVGSDAILSLSGDPHAAHSIIYQTAVNVQGFTAVFTFIPNGQNIAFVIQNNTASGQIPWLFQAGAGGEAGFSQFGGGGNIAPIDVFAMEFDEYCPATNGGSFNGSTVAIYQTLQYPCNPAVSTSGYLASFTTTKSGTSPVPINSPSSTQGSPSSDTFSVSLGYDGYTFSMCMYDVTAATGSCSSSTSGTGTYYQQSWTGVYIPSIVGATTAYVGFTGGTSGGSTPPIGTPQNVTVNSLVYTVVTPTGSPSYTTWNANSTYNTGVSSAASPVYSLAPGTYSGTQSVTMTTSTSPHNYICYVLSASTPTLYPQPDNNGGCSAGTLYTGAISIASTATLYAMAGSNNSAFGTATANPTGLGPPSTLVAATYTITPAAYYISPTGNDSNNGLTTGTAWLTPNHALHCGDTITAASGTYSTSNFQSGNWGTVTCAAGNNVAWLICTTFDACKISSSSSSAMSIGSSYWGVQGWEATTSSGGYACFSVTTSGTQTIHHIIFANDVANGCQGSGFQAYNASSTAVLDYIVFIGNIAWNAAQGSDACHSGMTIGFLRSYDSLAGTHLYVAGNYAWDNVDPGTCASTAATDGEGMEWDTLGEYGYSQQAVAENNIFAFNGGRGLEVGTNTNAYIFLEHNTLYGNNSQSGQLFPQGNGEITLSSSVNTTIATNLAMTSQATTGGYAIYAGALGGTNTGSTFAGNWLYFAAGNTTYGSGFGTNQTGTSPAFASVTQPGAPSCGSYANVPACAAVLVSNLTPSASGASAYGYQVPTGTAVVDVLYPQWLCSVTLPAGLINPGCLSSASGSTLYGAVMSGASIQ